MSELKTVSSEELRCVYGGRDELPPQTMAPRTGGQAGGGPTDAVQVFDDLEPWLPDPDPWPHPLK
jgi:hypothetical protein